jgi:AcrR family transcriptional regulator
MRPTPPPTAHKITTAARRLFERHGRDAVSMRRVANAVGITPMAIYRHYAGTPALMEAIAQQGFDELATHLQARRGKTAAVPYIARVMDAYVVYAIEQPRMFDLLFLERRAGARRFPEDFRAGRSPTGNVLARGVAEAMEEGTFRKDDVWEVAMAIWAHVHGLVVLYRAGRIDMDTAKLRAFCRRSLRRMLRGLTD